jgi:glycosyltransferase involved in cell wall biosynthesis
MPSPPSSRIALFTGSFGGGGIERVITNLSRSLVEQGFKVDLLLNQVEEFYLQVAGVPPEVRIIDLKSPKSLFKCFPALRHYLAEECPEVLFSTSAHLSLLALGARLLGQRVRTRIIISEHNMLSMAAASSELKWRIVPPLARWFYPWADGIVAVSQGVGEDLAHITGLPSDRIHVIYNPIITPDIFDKAEEPLEHPWFAPGQLPVILGAGRLETHKDFPTLIRAFALVRKAIPARLVIIGWGGDRPQLEALVQELGLTDDVEFPGYKKNPYQYMARSAVFVLSSITEGLGNVLVEAMALGIPVISTDCKSGPSEILAEGQYGLLTPVGNEKALAQAILEVLSGRVRKEVEPSWLNQFTIDSATQKYLDVFGIGSSIMNDIVFNNSIAKFHESN